VRWSTMPKSTVKNGQGAAPAMHRVYGKDEIASRRSAGTSQLVQPGVKKGHTQGQKFTIPLTYSLTQDNRLRNVPVGRKTKTNDA
jgi:hypothetical protein